MWRLLEITSDGDIIDDGEIYVLPDDRFDFDPEELGNASIAVATGMR
jgi:hypothetical protein